MALRKVFKDPLMSSTKGSLMGYLREPHSTECSRMWGCRWSWRGACGG